MFRSVVILTLFAACGFDTVQLEPLRAAGDIALLREDGKPRVVVPLADQGIAYCERKDDDWAGDWSVPQIHAHWFSFDAIDMFASVYHGFEVLGRAGDDLYFTYRDNQRRWRAETLLDTGARGRPAFLQLPQDDGSLILLGLVPSSLGGIGVYERFDTAAGQHWARANSRIARQLGVIDAVSVVSAGEGHLVAVLRTGPQLYVMFRVPSRPNEPLDQGWRTPERIHIVGNSTIAEVAGDPRLLLSAQGVVASMRKLLLAVPVRGSLLLLGADDVNANHWTLQRLPVEQTPDSVALMDGITNGRPSLEVVYRLGTDVFQSWRPAGGQWSVVRPLRCIR